MPRKKGTGPNIVRLTPGSKGKVVITESHPGRYVLGSPVPSAVFGGRFVCKDCSKDPCICNLAPSYRLLDMQIPEDIEQVQAPSAPFVIPAHRGEPVVSKRALAALVEADKKQIVQHSSESNEHYTPSDIVERARRLMGVIDLDPASCGEAQEIVKARHMYYTFPNGGAYKPANNVAACIEGDGLAMRPWKGNVFLNPPGGVFKVLNKSFSNAALWWAALVQDWLSGDVKEAIFIGFTLEILRHSQNGCPLPVQAFHRCYPKKRIKFSDAQQPTHANVIVYLPPLPQNLREEGRRTDFREPEEPYVLVIEHFARFRAEFGSLGYCE